MIISLNKEKDLNFHISRGLYFMLLTYMISILAVSSWLEFWVWFNFSLVGTWVLLEGKRLREIEILEKRGKRKVYENQGHVITNNISNS